MVDCQAYVYTTLSTALTCTVHYFYPPEGHVLPCASYREAENRVHSQADTNEYLTEVAYVIDLWSKSALVNATNAGLVDVAMSAAGFRRTFSYDLFEPDTGIHHKTMRYRALCTQDGILYQ